MLNTRRFLIAAVWLYLAWLIGLPITMLLVESLSGGLGVIAATLFRPDVLHALWITLLLAVLAVAVNAVFGLVSAWVLVRQRFVGRRVMNGLIDLPFAVSPVVAGYMFILLYGRDGWLHGLTTATGFKIAFALPGMALATIFVCVPFVIREVMPVLAQTGVDQEEAARTLGASGWQIFWRVTLPSIRWGLAYGISLTLARALGEFGAVFVVGAAVIGATETATIFIFRALDERMAAEAYIVSLVLIAAAILLLFGFERLRAHRRIEKEA